MDRGQITPPWVEYWILGDFLSIKGDVGVWGRHCLKICGWTLAKFSQVG